MDANTIEIAELALKYAGAIAAAAWAIALYFLLRKRALAGAKLRETEAKIRSIELAMKRQAVIRITIDPRIIKNLDGNGYVILATIDIRNLGTQATKITWHDAPPFVVRRFEDFDAQSGRPTFEEGRDFTVPLTYDPAGDAKSHLVRPGGCETISYAVHVTAGLYLLSFRGEVSAETREEVKELGATSPTVWSANKYVLVDEAACQAAAPAAANETAAYSGA